MQISKIQNSSSYHNNVSFSAITNFDRALPPDKGIISRKSIKLINELNHCIDKEWAEIKKNNKLSISPVFHTKDGKKTISFEPIYNMKFPALLIDIMEGKTTQKILMNRDNPNNFRYEKVIKTDHGSATLRSYNSINGRNEEIDKFVNNVIEDHLGRIISNKIWDRLLNRIDEGFD